MTKEIQKNETQEFSYGLIPSHNQEIVKNCVLEIKAGSKNIAENIIRIGEALIKAKENMPHGMWLPFLASEAGYSESFAKKYMQAARRFKSVKFTDFDISKSAVLLLGSPSVSEEAFEEAKERAEKGEKITHKTAKQIKEKHAPKKEKPEATKAPEPPKEETHQPENETPKRKSFPWEKENSRPFKPEYAPEEYLTQMRNFYPDTNMGHFQVRIRNRLVEVLNDFFPAAEMHGLKKTGLVKEFEAIIQDIFFTETSLKNQ